MLQTVQSSGRQPAIQATLANQIEVKRIYTILTRFGYSHLSAPNIPKQEVEQAIDAVGNFLKLAVQK